MMRTDTIVQLTHDMVLREHATTVRKGTAGRVLATTVLRRTYVVEFPISTGHTIVAKVDGKKLVEVQPNVRA